MWTGVRTTSTDATADPEPAVIFCGADESSPDLNAFEVCLRPLRTDLRATGALAHPLRPGLLHRRPWHPAPLAAVPPPRPRPVRAAITAEATNSPPSRAKGAAVPATPARRPAPAGAATWPRRLPVRRSAGAVLRARSGAACTTVVIDSGWPTPRQKPRASSIAASAHTGTGSTRPPHSTPADAQLAAISAVRPSHRIIGVITSRQAMVAAARRLSSRPMVVGAMARSSPTTGR